MTLVEANLKTELNKLSHLDYLIEQRHTDPETNTTLHLRYIPDTDLITTEDFQNYCLELDFQNSQIDQLASQILFDFNNILIPRFIQIHLNHKDNLQITIEDSQPGWHNKNFLDRLAKI